MNSFTLKPFTSCAHAMNGTASYSFDQGVLNPNYSFNGIKNLLIPARSANPRRMDKLYEETCFEVFLLGEEEKYLEFNFSPSGDWCLFAFQGYRNRIRHSIEMDSSLFSNSAFKSSPSSMHFQTTISFNPLLLNFLGDSKTLKLNMTVVLKARDGSKSYWAVKHPSDKPDFHRPALFLPLA